MCRRVAILKEGRLVGVQDINELKENGYKRVSVQSAARPIPGGFFDGMAGVANLACSGDSASFIYMGSTAALVRKLGELDIGDLFLEEPSLDEIFLHYYQQ
jgi:ABC-2 type transport system ATP-binding protein